MLVHGIGGPRPAEQWIGPLNASLEYLGYPRIVGALDTVVNVDYMAALRGGESDLEPPLTWTPTNKEDTAFAWSAYLARQEAMAEAIEGTRKRSALWPLAPLAGTPVVDWVADEVRPVSKYVSSKETRNAVWSSVLGQLPSEGRAIVIAHSLGSIVMLDLLARLPQDLHIDLLLTIGSPMGVRALTRHHGGIDTVSGFPSPAVGSWVNVYDRDDVVTVSRGAAGRFPAALDAPIDTGRTHELRAYMSQPVVAAAVGLACFGRPSTPPDNAIARPLDPQWQPLLLRFAFTHELWNSWPKGEWRMRGRMDLARRVLAERTVNEALEHRQTLLDQAAAMPEEIRGFFLERIAESAVAPGHMPEVDDLVRHAGEHMRNEYSDEQLVVAAVDLLMTSPFLPFEIDVDKEPMRTTLAYLLQRVRRDGSGVSGREFADAVSDAIKEARSVIDGNSIPWSGVLVGAGVLLLAATGVGLVVAAPAGLAGAAAITATLATFGPGGMAGGVATLAVLTGTSMAFTTAGLAIQVGTTRQIAALQTSMAQEIAHLPKQAFRSAIAQLLAVFGARRRLELTSIAADVESTLLLIQSAVLHELRLHVQIGKGSDAARDWQAKADILDKALDWLARKAPEDIPSEARASVIAALEGKAPLALPPA